jgi:hypothetical protein
MDVNNFVYLVIWQAATWLLKDASMVCSSNSPKLAKIEAVQRMAIDSHGFSTTPKDLAFHAFLVCNKICAAGTLTAFMNSAE